MHCGTLARKPWGEEAKRGIDESRDYRHLRWDGLGGNGGSFPKDHQDYAAAREGHTDVVRLLREAGAKE